MYLCQHSINHIPRINMKTNIIIRVIPYRIGAKTMIEHDHQHCGYSQDANIIETY